VLFFIARTPILKMGVRKKHPLGVPFLLLILKMGVRKKHPLGVPFLLLIGHYRFSTDPIFYKLLLRIARAMLRSIIVTIS
jgi:hypothetical protein